MTLKTALFSCIGWADVAARLGETSLDPAQPRQSFTLSFARPAAKPKAATPLPVPQAAAPLPPSEPLPNAAQTFKQEAMASADAADKLQGIEPQPLKVVSDPSPRAVGSSAISGEAEREGLQQGAAAQQSKADQGLPTALLSQGTAAEPASDSQAPAAREDPVAVDEDEGPPGGKQDCPEIMLRILEYVLAMLCFKGSTKIRRQHVVLCSPL